MSSDYRRLTKFARANRMRFAREANERAMQEEVSKAIAVRENMARLRGLRLAIEAQEVRTEMAKGNQPAKSK